MRKSNLPLLAVGSIALDSLQTHQGSCENVLGGSATYFGLAARLFSPVSIVGVVGQDFPKPFWDLYAQRKIDTHNIQTCEGKTFRWGGKYNEDYTTRETLFTELGVFEKFQPIISEDYTAPNFLFLGNIQPDLQLNVAAQMKNVKTIVCDTMNLWIDLCPDRLWGVVELVDVFLLNDEESLQLTGCKTIYDAADKLLAAGPSIVIIKRGGQGSLLANQQERIEVPVYPIDRLVDPTGAGDSFAGGFIGSLIQQKNNNLTEAVVTGTAVASFTVSDFGTKGLLQADPDKIDDRKNIIRSLMEANQK